MIKQIEIQRGLYSYFIPHNLGEDVIASVRTESGYEVTPDIYYRNDCVEFKFASDNPMKYKVVIK